MGCPLNLLAGRFFVGVNVPYELQTRIFGDCPALTSIHFPLVDSIEQEAFANCINLESVSLGTAHTTSTKIGFGPNVFRNGTTGNFT